MARIILIFAKLAILVGGLAPGLVQAAEILVTPTGPVAPHTQLSIRLHGFAPNAIVELTASRSYGDPPALFRSTATFRTDGEGNVDLSASAPTSGSYAVADSAGLLWSMARTDEPVTASASGLVRLEARMDGALAASTQIQLRAARDDLVIEPISRFPGAILVRPAGSRGRLPVIIVLGGSEGGSQSAQEMAPRLASHGYAVLGLPYYSPARGQPAEFPALPSSFTDIPIERLDTVHRYLLTRRDLDPRRIGLYGISKGAEFSLVAATRYPWLRAVVAIAATDVVWEGFGPASLPRGSHSSFAFNGRPLPFVPYGQLGQGSLREAHDRGRRANPEAAAHARIPVEHYEGDLMVVGAGADRVWPSGAMAQAIAERRAEAGRRTQVLIFPEAGHNLARNPLDPAVTIVGGTPQANAEAQITTWRATIAFLARALGPN